MATTAEYSDSHATSDFQHNVFDYLLTHNWTEAQVAFGITARSTLRRCIVRTALGYRWAPDNNNRNVAV